VQQRKGQLDKTRSQGEQSGKNVKMAAKGEVIFFLWGFRSNCRATTNEKRVHERKITYELAGSPRAGIAEHLRVRELKDTASQGIGGLTPISRGGAVKGEEFEYLLSQTIKMEGFCGQRAGPIGPKEIGQQPWGGHEKLLFPSPQRSGGSAADIIVPGKDGKLRNKGYGEGADR